ncbi:hypothetical protein C8Q78DRAFT_1027940 [Trametes maxima]|nr:hypothetical protein C8Q78DRAFT_1027940 [Trametes maxima]
MDPSSERLSSRPPRSRRRTHLATRPSPADNEARPCGRVAQSSKEAPPSNSATPRPQSPRSLDRTKLVAPPSLGLTRGPRALSP